MGYFFGSYDPDIIETALGHQDKKTVYHAYNRATDPDQRVQMVQDWADLVDHFTWRQQPIGPGKILGIA